MEKENIIFSEKKKKNGEEKGGKYLEKENIWSVEKKKNGEGKGEGNILKRVCFVQRGEKERRMKRRKIFGPRRRKRTKTKKEAKYLKKENIYRRKIF